MDKNVLKVLEDKLWYVATCSEYGPTVIPVGFKAVADDGRLLIGDVAMKVTADNVKNGSPVSIAVTDMKNNIGLGIKGTAIYIEEGPELDILNKMADKKNYPYRARGAIVITPSHVYSTLPGPDNGANIDWPGL